MCVHHINSYAMTSASNPKLKPSTFLKSFYLVSMTLKSQTLISLKGTNLVWRNYVVGGKKCCKRMVIAESSWQNHILWKDFYKILEVDYDATEETIRSNYIRLALKCHPDKKKGEESSTSKFQELNNAYQVLADPIKRKEYNKNLVSSSLVDFKALVLTCNGLGVRHWIF
ncbi:hypothetical protein ZOSMA_23G01040 [Zostera marina]|uniref:J domain-containing protein n=1 Tax=Zostera marina TaxID=29655 RepID=A0A0K9PJL7_ZOSMR|nr:hypothetical protein ZOSMA_23G01040 [Zostera marina]